MFKYTYIGDILKLNNIRSYILEEEFKVILNKNKLNIINYIELIDFNDFEIKIKYKDGILLVSGNNLRIKKILNDELLIEGNILNIELR